MTGALYQIFINIFQWLMNLAGNFNAKIKLGVEGRAGLLNHLRNDFQNQTDGRSVAWFHAASLGEFEQGRPVMEAYRQKYPEHFILLTFFSPSGYEIRKNYAGADYICYLPIDTRHNAKEFVKLVNPKIAFFIKYEFWYNYLRALNDHHTVIISFSTIFRPGQAFFKWYGGFYRKMLFNFNHLYVQNEESLELLKGVGVNQCSLAGDTRFDRVYAIAQQVKDLPIIADFVRGENCLVVGSAWETDMEVLIPAVNALDFKLKIIIAPHEIKPEEIKQWQKKLSGASVLYSELNQGKSGNYDILFIDNIGMLSSLYRYGSMASIGGSFGSGLHNILEAATFGLPVTFGNKGYYKFAEAKELIQKGGAVAVADTRELIAILQKWSKEKNREEAGKICSDYVAARVGATKTIMSGVDRLLK